MAFFTVYIQAPCSTVSHAIEVRAPCSLSRYSDLYVSDVQNICIRVKLSHETQSQRACKSRFGGSCSSARQGSEQQLITPFEWLFAFGVRLHAVQVLGLIPHRDTSVSDALCSGHAPTNPEQMSEQNFNYKYVQYFSFVNFKMGNVLMLTLLSLIYTKEFWD